MAFFMVCLMSAFVMASTTWSSTAITRARTPWGSAYTSGPTSPSNSSARLVTSGSGKAYTGNLCKMNKTGKNIVFKAKMACTTSPQDLMGNEWSCLDAKTIQCKGARCPYGQCGIIGR